MRQLWKKLKSAFFGKRGRDFPETARFPVRENKVTQEENPTTKKEQAPPPDPKSSKGSHRYFARLTGVSRGEVASMMEKGRGTPGVYRKLKEAGWKG